MASKTRREGKRGANDTDRRRAAILRAAIRIFARDGFRNTDVQDIADRAGVGKGTVYRHFGTKEDLFLAAVDKGTSELGKTILSRVEPYKDEPLKHIEVGLRTYFSFFDKNKDLVEIFIQERSEFRGHGKATYFAHRDMNINVLEGLLRQGTAKGIFRPMNYSACAEVISDLAFGTVIAHLMKGSRRRLVSRTQEVLRICLDGIRNHGNRGGRARQ